MPINIRSVATRSTDIDQDATLDQIGLRPLNITARQLEVLYWVQEGKSASDIGGILGLSHRTVEHHLEKVCSRLGVRTRVQAMLKVRDLGLIPEGESYPLKMGRPTRS